MIVKELSTMIMVVPIISENPDHSTTKEPGTRRNREREGPGTRSGNPSQPGRRPEAVAEHVG